MHPCFLKKILQYPQYDDDDYNDDDEDDDDADDYDDNHIADHHITLSTEWLMMYLLVNHQLHWVIDITQQ